MTLGHVVDDNENKLKGDEGSIKIIEAINEAVVRVYGHPKDQTNTRLLTPGFFTLTFHTERNSQKESLLMMMYNDPTLTTRLNEEFRRVEILSKARVFHLSPPVYTDTSGKVILKK